MAARSELGSVPTLVTRVDDSDSLAYVLNGFIAPVATSPREGPPLSPPILVRDSSQSPLDMIDPKDLTLIVVAGRSLSASADSGVAFRLDGFIVDPETDSTRTVGDVASIVGATLPEAGEWPPLSDPILVGDSFPHPLDVIDPSELTLVAGNGAAPSPSGSPDQSIRGADVPPIPEERAEPGPRAVIEGAPGTPSMRYAIRPVLVPEPGESAGWRAVSLEEAERVARFRPRTVPGRAIASVWVGTFQLNQVVAVVQDLPDDRQMTLFQSLNPVVGEGSGVSGSIRLEGGRLTVFGRADVPPESLRALLESLR